MAFLGVAWSISGEQGLSITQIAANVATNPITYLILTGAFLLAIYCNLTKRIAKAGRHYCIFYIIQQLAYGLSMR